MVSEFKHIAKGPVCCFLDELSRSQDAAARLRALAKDLDKLSGSYGGLVGVLDRHLFKSLGKESRKKITDHLRKRWFSSKTGWWGHLQPVAPVYARGIAKAIEESVGKGSGKNKAPKSGQALPIDSYWIVVDDRFELTVMRSRHQVTLLIMTPRPSGPAKLGGIGDLDTAVSIVSREETPPAKRPVIVDGLKSSTLHQARK